MRVTGKRKQNLKLQTLELISAAGNLKRIKRAGWLRKCGITSDCESVADHSFGVVLLGTLIGIEMNLDYAKVARMCLIHDLAESVIGDRTPEDKKSAKAHRLEEDRVMRDLLGDLPPKTRSVLLEDWKELVKSNTKEALLTWQIDKLEMALQAKDYMRMGYNKENLKEFVEQTFSDEVLISILKSY